MRLHPTAGVSALFIDDVPGGCLVSCEQCGHTFIQSGGTSDIKKFCDECHSEVCYRPWYEW